MEQGLPRTPPSASINVEGHRLSAITTLSHEELEVIDSLMLLRSGRREKESTLVAGPSDPSAMERRESQASLNISPPHDAPLLVPPRPSDPRAKGHEEKEHVPEMGVRCGRKTPAPSRVEVYVESQMFACSKSTLAEHSLFFAEHLKEYNGGNTTLPHQGIAPQIRLGTVTAIGFWISMVIAIRGLDNFRKTEVCTYSAVIQALHAAHTLKFEGVVPGLAAVFTNLWQDQHSGMAVEDKAVSLFVARLCGVMEVAQESFREVLLMAPLPASAIDKYNFGSVEQVQVASTTLKNLYVARDLSLGMWQAVVIKGTESLRLSTYQCWARGDQGGLCRAARNMSHTDFQRQLWRGGIYQLGVTDMTAVLNRLSALQFGLCKQCYAVYWSFWQARKTKLQACINDLSRRVD